jgi:hypothetical protein
MRGTIQIHSDVYKNIWNVFHDYVSLKTQGRIQHADMTFLLISF